MDWIVSILVSTLLLALLTGFGQDMTDWTPFWVISAAGDSDGQNMSENLITSVPN
jgi:hypothetical protein